MDIVYYRPLEFNDLNAYKNLLSTHFPHGFVGILFKEICENSNENFFAQGAFIQNQLIGFIIGIKEYEKVRQLSEFEHGLSAVMGKKLAHVPVIVVEENFRRQKIGKTLLDNFLVTIPNATIFVYIPRNSTCSSPYSNVAAQHFFEAVGFSFNSTLRKFYNEFEDAFVFVK